METIILLIFVSILLIAMRGDLLLENLALRQQFAIMKQKNKRPKISMFWMADLRSRFNIKFIVQLLFLLALL